MPALKYDYSIAKELVEQSDITLQAISNIVNIRLDSLKSWYKNTYPRSFRLSRWKQSCRNRCFGAGNPNWKDGRSYCDRGYVLVDRPLWYTGRGRFKHGYKVLEHHIVYCNANNLTELPKDMVLHHIGSNRSNNDIDNLCLMTRSDHTRLHRLLSKATTKI